MSMTTPSSQTAVPAMLCPPPRTESSSPWLRANRIACGTSSASPQRTISAGRRSIIAFHTLRAAS